MNEGWKRPGEFKLKDVSELQKKPDHLKVKKVTIIVETEDAPEMKVEMVTDEHYEVLMGNITLARGWDKLEGMKGTHMMPTNELDVETSFYLRKRQ